MKRGIYLKIYIEVGSFQSLPYEQEKVHCFSNFNVYINHLSICHTIGLSGVSGSANNLPGDVYATGLRTTL